MKNWLIQKVQEQNNLFQDFMQNSMTEIKLFNEQEKKEVAIRVIFSKDEWLDGEVKVEFLQKNSNNEYDVKDTYFHSIYNSNHDIYANGLLAKLMSKGLFTNAWFSILDSSRSYDTTIVLTERKYILENQDCEHRENRMKKTHSGFNILSPQEKKNKLK